MDDNFDPFIQDDLATITIVNRSDIKMFRMLIQHKDFNPCNNESWALISCCHSGEIEFVEELLKFNVPFVDQEYAFIGAAARGNLNLVKLLLSDERFDPSSMENEPMKSAFCFEHTEIVDLLWNDKRVKNSLKVNGIEIYKQLTKKDNKIKIKSF